MKKIYVFAIVALGALAVSTSCKKDKSADCITTCGEEYCEDDYNKEVDAAKAEGETVTMTWSQYKAFMSAMGSSVDCSEE